MVTPTQEKRLTGAENVIWDLSIFYASPTDPKIDEDFQKLHGMSDAFADAYKGKLASLSPSQMRQAQEQAEQIFDLRGRIYTYASLLYSTNTTDPEIGALFQKVQEMAAQIGQKVIFFELEWGAMDEATAQGFINAPELAKYSFQLASERRYKPYQLSEIEEQLLIEKSVTGRSAWTRLFTQIISSLRPEFDGEKMNMQQMLVKVRDEDRDVRKKAADAITAVLKERAMELTYIFNTLAADKASEDKRRQYPSWISSRNLDNLAPDAVVESLVNTVTSNYGYVERHYNLKRKLLQLDELTDYDRYAPIPTGESEAFYTWDEAKAMVLNAFYAFSQEAGDAAKRFFDENWIHAPVLPNKRGGAFASPSVPSAHPFVFVNFEGTADNVSTLAHELGHGIHMYLSGQAHGFQGLYTPLTTAEMASVFAEMVVFQDLMKKESNPKARLAMLMGKVEDTFATVYRQLSMNRFEDRMHNARRTQGELTTAQLNEMWLETQRAMFGESVNLRDDYGIWWAYIPHFLQTPGYVYAYAFGELLVLALYNLYLERGESFIPQYIDILRAGGSDYPDKILGTVGLDLNDPNFWQNGISAIKALVEEEESLAREVYPELF